MQIAAPTTLVTETFKSRRPLPSCCRLVSAACSCTRHGAFPAFSAAAPALKRSVLQLWTSVAPHPSHPMPSGLHAWGDSDAKWNTTESRRMIRRSSNADWTGLYVEGTNYPHTPTWKTHISYPNLRCSRGSQRKMQAPVQENLSRHP